MASDPVHSIGVRPDVHAIPGHSPSDHFYSVLSYVISFGSFYLFVCVAKQLVAKPSFRHSNSLFARLLHACVSEQLDPAEKLKQEEEESDKSAKARSSESFCYSALHLCFCAVGIIVSYVLWGYMQERIMTQKYATDELFSSSKFLVFANRLLALLVAYTAREIQRSQGTNVAHTAPLYQFSYSSVSNIVSSVCQYEALKYISFPTQVLSKSCKMVPVMMMGYLVSRKVYPCSEYLVAILVTAGVFIFKSYEANDAPVKNTELVGIAFITAYMICDSFTSNWQSRVFKQYSVGSITMMMYANLFSSAFTALGLVVTWEIGGIITFITANPAIIYHIVVMAICSAIGQLFIFHTIKTYGPLVFATIQTLRQLISIFNSIVQFGHPIVPMEGLGIGIVFFAIGLQIFLKWQSRRTPSKPTTPPLPMVSEEENSPEAVRTTPDSFDEGAPSQKEVQRLIRKNHDQNI